MAKKYKNVRDLKKEGKPKKVLQSRRRRLRQRASLYRRSIKGSLADGRLLDMALLPPFVEFEAKNVVREILEAFPGLNVTQKAELIQRAFLVEKARRTTLKYLFQPDQKFFEKTLGVKVNASKKEAEWVHIMPSTGLGIHFVLSPSLFRKSAKKLLKQGAENYTGFIVPADKVKVKELKNLISVVKGQEDGISTDRLQTVQHEAKHIYDYVTKRIHWQRENQHAATLTVSDWISLTEKYLQDELTAQLRDNKYSVSRMDNKFKRVSEHFVKDNITALEEYEAMINLLHQQESLSPALKRTLKNLETNKEAVAETKQKFDNSLPDMETVHKKNLEAIVSALKVIPHEELSAIVANMPFGRIAKRLPEIAKRYKKKKPKK